MPRSCTALALLVCGCAWAQAPVYTASDIVNASDYSSAPFAPNSVVTIFGSNLSWYTGVFAVDPTAGNVPTTLEGVQIYVDNWPAPVLYVSATQVNFVIPSNEIAGNATIRLEREGVTGPIVTVPLVNGAPALFEMGNGFAIATHLDGSVLTDASPAQPGEYVVVYATGLGATDPIQEAGEVPGAAAPLHWLSSLTVTLNGAVVPPGLIEYAGVTPGFLGLYQLNIQLPQNVGTDPTILVSLGTQQSSTPLKIAVQ